MLGIKHIEKLFKSTTTTTTTTITITTKPQQTTTMKSRWNANKKRVIRVHCMVHGKINYGVVRRGKNPYIGMEFAVFIQAKLVTFGSTYGLFSHTNMK